jgi:hypothetical protein
MIIFATCASSMLDKAIKNIALKKISICNCVKFIYLEINFFIKIYLSELDFESSCQESEKVLKFKERLQKYILLIIHQRDPNTKSWKRTSLLNMSQLLIHWIKYIKRKEINIYILTFFSYPYKNTYNISSLYLKGSFCWVGNLDNYKYVEEISLDLYKEVTWPANWWFKFQKEEHSNFILSKVCDWNN